MHGNQQTSCYTNTNETSSLQWQFIKETNEVVTRKQKQMRNEFLKWLITKQTKTNVDFKLEVWHWKISDDKMVNNARV